MTEVKKRWWINFISSTVRELIVFFIIISLLVMSIKTYLELNSISNDISILKSDINSMKEEFEALQVESSIRYVEIVKYMVGEVQEQVDEINEFIPIDIPLNENLQEYIYYQSIKYGIDPDIVYSLISVESNYIFLDPEMDSNGYLSYGYTQINDINYEYLSDAGIDYTTEEGCIDACLYLLYPLIDNYGIYDGLRAYNCGEQGMLNGGGHSYATKVLEGI